MSRPPMFPTLSPSGIQDAGGERKVASSRRPDGTFRKELKIRPGFTPEEDVTRYRTRMGAESEARAAVKGRIPGMAPPSVQFALAGMSKSQKKNAKRKEKKTEGVDGEEEDVPDDWDADDDGTSPKPTTPASTSAPSSDAKLASAPSPPPPPPPPVVEDSKRVKALKKKLRQAELLKERDTLGLYLPPAERTKIKGIPDLEAELEKLVLSEKDGDKAAQEFKTEGGDEKEEKKDEKP